tara:strand:+ start:194 stop:802 length:609 start_codon:yes stop_codon:yes gene_type:complete
MKITKSYLRKLIKEEVANILEQKLANKQKTPGAGEFTKIRKNPIISEPEYSIYVGKVDEITAYKFTVRKRFESNPSDGAFAAQEPFGEETESAVLVIEQSFESGRAGREALKSYLKANLKFPTVDAKKYVDSIDDEKIDQLSFFIGRKGYLQSDAAARSGRPLRQPDKYNESNNSENEFILEAHRKGRNLSPAVKNLWWLDA